MFKVTLPIILVYLMVCVELASAYKIEFDVPETKTVFLRSKASLRCLVTDWSNLRWTLNSIQIVRSQVGQQTVLSKGAILYETESRYYKVAKLEINQTSPMKVELVFEILSVRTVDSADFKCRMVNHHGNVLAEDIVKLQIIQIPRIDSFTANERREFVEVSRGSDVEFKCLASGSPSVNLSLIKTTSDGREELVHISRHRNRLEFGIDASECRHSGVYRCQMDRNVKSAKKVKVKVRNCDSNEDDANNSAYTKYLAVRVVIPCVCAAAVTLAAVVIFRHVKRHNSCKSSSTNRSDEGKAANSTRPNMSDVFMLSPPPYSICRYVADMGGPPPSYPGEKTETGFTLDSRVSQKAVKDPSKVEQLQSENQLYDLPPPYPHSEV